MAVRQQTLQQLLRLATSSHRALSTSSSASSPCLAEAAGATAAASRALLPRAGAISFPASATRAFSAAPQGTPAAAAAAASTPTPAPPPPPRTTPKNPATFLRTLLLGGFAAAGIFTYAIFTSDMPQKGPLTPKPEVKKDYGAVRKALEGIMDVEGYDDGSYGPLLVRLAWHASGTFDKTTNTGGSNGATMRFSPECAHGANAGLSKAREVLEPIKARFPWISYADLWTLAGVVAIESMGGPTIPWRAGRVDKVGGEACPPDGRLPDALQGAAHVRSIFGRMGFDDQEMVALIGAHALGRCHTDRSGFTNPWTNAPTTFSNLYFTELLNTKWTKKKWAGPLQYEDPTGNLMMLPTDMALVWDRKFKKIVNEYAKSEDKFFADFAAAFSKLLELGVEFPEPAQAQAQVAAA